MNLKLYSVTSDNDKLDEDTKCLTVYVMAESTIDACDKAWAKMTEYEKANYSHGQSAKEESVKYNQREIE